MNYYDNVKDTVKNNKSGSGGGGFDTLKEAAEEGIDEEEGDDTPIEVLEEGGLKQKTSQSTSQESTETVNNKKNVSADLSSIEDKLDKIIEQNDALIEIMESFKS